VNIIGRNLNPKAVNNKVFFDAIRDEVLTATTRLTVQMCGWIIFSLCLSPVTCDHMTYFNTLAGLTTSTQVLSQKQNLPLAASAG
jgi:hypothetical protein